MDALRHPPEETADEAVTRLVGALERYAGWLGRDRVSVAVRANVQALAIALGSDTVIAPCLRRLENDLQRLPGGDVKRILRNALTELSNLLEGPGETR